MLGVLKNGQTADGVIGETYHSSSAHLCCGRIKVDQSGRLWVLGTDATHFIKVYQLPLTEQSAPIKTIRTSRVSLPVLGSSERVTLGPKTLRIQIVGGPSQGAELTVGPFIRSIAPVGNGDMIWISDSYNHRVLRIRNPLTNPVVDVILGQKDATGNKCNRRAQIGPWESPAEVLGSPEADMLCFPGGLAYDRLGNLYVSDHSLEVAGNKRLLVFAADSIPLDNQAVIYAPAATKVFSNLDDVEDKHFAHSWAPRQTVDTGSVYLGRRLPATWDPAFDSANRMAVGFSSYLGPRFIAFYTDPLGPDPAPSGFFRDFVSMPYAATFDENDNLYVTDINYNRILIYWNPFSSPGDDRS